MAVQDWMAPGPARAAGWMAASWTTAGRTAATCSGPTEVAGSLPRSASQRMLATCVASIALRGTAPSRVRVQSGAHSVGPGAVGT